MNEVQNANQYQGEFDPVLEQQRETEAAKKRMEARKRRRDRDNAMRDMGMVKVKGNLGGTYWE
jgi:hypothetical protein